MHKLKQLLSKSKRSDGSSSKSATGSGDSRRSIAKSSASKEVVKDESAGKTSSFKEHFTDQVGQQSKINTEPLTDGPFVPVDGIHGHTSGRHSRPTLNTIQHVGGGYKIPVQNRPEEKLSGLRSLSTIPSVDEVQASSSRIVSCHIHSGEYSFLHTINPVFVIDDSAAMADRWQGISLAMQELVPICAQYVRSGIEVAFPNKLGSFLHVRSAEEVASIFENTTTIRTASPNQMLCTILRSYMENLKNGTRHYFEPLHLIVIISGPPTDDSPYFELRNVIERNAQKLKVMDASLGQIGIHFFQIGQDAGVARLLQKLDDDSRNGTLARDIVDAKTYRTYDGVLSPQMVFGVIEEHLARTKKGKGKA